MEPNFFTNLPSEITAYILSRLPVRSVAISKCVCKPWLNLLNSCDFVKSHLSKIKTPPDLAILMPNKRVSTRCTIFEIEDEADLKSHELHYIPLADIDIPHRIPRPSMKGITANGLLLLYREMELLCFKTPVYICNPITREYIGLCRPKKCSSVYGFGVSKISKQYKVVCINRNPESNSGPHVHTLGTRTWKLIEAGAASGCRFYSDLHTVCNGNLHLTVSDMGQPLRICAFDVETECFSIFSAPLVPVLYGVDGFFNVLSDCMCYSYMDGNDIVIWMIKEYQVEESWTIEYKISTIGFDFHWDCGYDWPYMPVNPIKVFKDGDVLMLVEEKRLIYYSNKTRTIQEVRMFKDASARTNFTFALLFTPSFLSLKSFGIKNVILF